MIQADDMSVNPVIAIPSFTPLGPVIPCNPAVLLPRNVQNKEKTPPDTHRVQAHGINLKQISILWHVFSVTGRYYLVSQLVHFFFHKEALKPIELSQDG